ncbi:MAG: hypothetical protein KAG97_10070 [Victivallales bacterium]|nr:hypothetical protein [Victivallales bacterium]
MTATVKIPPLAGNANLRRQKGFQAGTVRIQNKNNKEIPIDGASGYICRSGESAADATDR